VKFAPSAGRSPGSANCGGSNSQTRNSPSLSLSLSLSRSELQLGNKLTPQYDGCGHLSAGSAR